jgi:hypothetical protein
LIFEDIKCREANKHRVQVLKRQSHEKTNKVQKQTIIARQQATPALEQVMSGVRGMLAHRTTRKSISIVEPSKTQFELVTFMNMNNNNNNNNNIINNIIRHHHTAFALRQRCRVEAKVAIDRDATAVFVAIAYQSAKAIILIDDEN